MDRSTLQLPFPDAIAAIRNKVPLPSTSWKTYNGQLQDVAFTISGITKASLLADIQAAVIRQLEQGIEIDEFRKTFDDLLTKSGWNLPGGRAYRAELVIQQNMRTAYSAGQYKQMTDPAVMKTTGAWMWRHRDSRVPRPAHKALDGALLDPNSDFWDKGGWPPCGFGCKCRVFKISKRELGDRPVQAPPPVSTIVDKGFEFIPGKTQKKQLLKEAGKRLPPEFAKLLDNSTDFGETLNFGSRANSKKPNCTTNKSHFCQTANGRGSCVPLSKKCKFKPTGAEKEAADYIKIPIYTAYSGDIQTDVIADDPNIFKIGQSDNFPVTTQEFNAATLEVFNPDVKGMNSLFRATINGKDYFVKRPALGKSDPELAAAELRNEIAAKRIADAVGYGDRYLDVAVMEKEGKFYVVTPLIKGETAARSKMTLTEYIDSPEREKEVRETMALDYVIASRDRHMGNIFYQEDGGSTKMIMIDNGLSFGDGYHWERSDSKSIYYADFTNNDNALYLSYDSVLISKGVKGGLDDALIPQDVKDNMRENREKILSIAKESGVPENLLAARLDHLEKSENFGQLIEPDSPNTKVESPRVAAKFRDVEYSNTQELLNAINKLYLD